MSECISCRKTKAPLACEICEGELCKNCVQRLDENTFSFWKEIPEDLTHHVYCGACYDEKVAPALSKYEEIMERAKGAFVFFTTQKKEIPLVKKSKDTLVVKNCPDRDETIMRLAFFAAEEGYNAIVEVDVNAEKVRNGSYQTSNWSGTGIAATVNRDKMDRMDELEKVYR